MHAQRVVVEVEALQQGAGREALNVLRARQAVERKVEVQQGGAARQRRQTFNSA